MKMLARKLCTCLRLLGVDVLIWHVIEKRQHVASTSVEAPRRGLMEVTLQGA